MNLKKLTIIALAVFYSFFLFILSTDTLVSDILQVRKNIIIHSEEKETLLLSKPLWSSFASKEEFKYKDNYYDVKNVVVYENYVKVEAVKDMFELVIKDITKNLNTKNKKANSLHLKKSIVLYYEPTASIGFVYSSEILKSNYFYCTSIKNNFSSSLFRPPCFS